MTLQALHKTLKSRPFKSTNDRGQNFTFSFTHAHIFRDGEHISDYDLEEQNGHLYIKLCNIKRSMWTGDFKNVLLVSDDDKELLNYDEKDLQVKGRIDITLVGQ